MVGSAVLLTVCLASAERQPAVTHEAMTLPSGLASYEAVVESGAEPGGSRQRFVARVIGPAGADPQPLSVSNARIWVIASRLPAVRGGDRVRLCGQVTALADMATASFAAYLGSRRIDGSMNALGPPVSWSGCQTPLRVIQQGSWWSRAADDVRLAMVGVLRAGSPGESGALLAGLVTGDDAGLSPERRLAFRRAGLSHITAISGSNVALLMAILLGRRRFSRRGRNWAVLVAATALVWAYAVVVRLDPPVVRAAIVATGGVIALRLGRRPDGMTLTGLAAAGTAVLVPGWLGSLSFLLSFAAAIVLILAMGDGDAQGTMESAWSAVKAVVAVNLVTIPILLSAGAEVSLTGIGANLVLGPIAAIAFTLGFGAACVGLVSPEAGEVLAVPAGWVANGVILGADRFGGEWASYRVWRLSEIVIWAGFFIAVGTVWIVGWEGRSVRAAVGDLIRARSPRPS